MSLKEIEIENFYDTTGAEIVENVVKPLLAVSNRYERLTGYFNLDALVSIAAGLEQLYRNQGQMRLVLGVHDVPGNLLAAEALSELLPAQRVKQMSEDLLAAAGTLVDVAEKSALAAVAWMLRLELLEVRVAVPKSTLGIFHQKRMIFHDRDNNVVAGTGSLNETRGSQGNIEEMHFSFSWLGEKDQTERLSQSFTDIWEGKHTEIDLVPLDRKFAAGLLNALDRPGNPFDDEDTALLTPRASGDFLAGLRTSQSLSPWNLSTACLYPHQERVFVEALSRWPIRALLADEVGLGKTLEAGAIVSYLLRNELAKSVTILVPASLQNQWQEEMLDHFALSFWRYEPSEKAFVNSFGERKAISWGDSNKASLNLKIASAQWARINADTFTSVLPEALLVDEAHAARLTSNAYGTQSTKLYRLLDQVKNKVTHLLLLSATPMQMHMVEFFGLLKLLGLPRAWQKVESFETSLRFIGTSVERLSLGDASQIANLLLSSLDEFGLDAATFSPAENSLINILEEAAMKSDAKAAITIQKNIAAFRNLLVKVHPAQLLVCRNTKPNLAKFGYLFPEREFESPRIQMTPAIQKFDASVTAYMKDAYGKAEEALYPAISFPSGFAGSTYYQRLASSLHAAQKSLLKREAKLNSLEKEILTESESQAIQGPSDMTELFDFEEEDVSLSESVDDDDYEGETILDKEKADKVLVAVRLEKSYLRDLLLQLENIGSPVYRYDLKFRECLQQVEALQSKGPVLVFSRYTDTLEGIINLYKESELFEKSPNYAIYTGSESVIVAGASVTVVSKTQVRDALAEGRVHLIFCSEAASEGLNLQAAKSLINLDVPWNPARLEQRIGRIARLGQEARSVKIVNLWYPDSIEAKMYQRLLSRRDDYMLAVGFCAEIVSHAIRSEVLSKNGSETEVSLRAHRALQDARGNLERIALERVWGSTTKERSRSEKAREDLVALAKAKGIESAYRYSAAAGKKSSITLLSPLIDELMMSIQPKWNPSESTDVYLVGFKANGLHLAFGVETSDGCFRLLRTEKIPNAIAGLAGLAPLKATDLQTRPLTLDAVSLLSALRDEPNMPNPHRQAVPIDVEFLPTLDDFSAIEVVGYGWCDFDLAA